MHLLRARLENAHTFFINADAHPSKNSTKTTHYYHTHFTFTHAKVVVSFAKAANVLLVASESDATMREHCTRPLQRNEQPVAPRLTF